MLNVNELNREVRSLREQNIQQLAMIDELTKENSELIQKAAKADELEIQINNFLKNPSNAFTVSIGSNFEIEDDTKYENESIELKKQLKIVSAERDKYINEISQLQHYREMLSAKNQEIVDLNNELSQAKADQAAFDKVKEKLKQYQDKEIENGSQLSELQCLRSEINVMRTQATTLKKEISDLKKINLDLETRNTALNKELAQKSMLLNVQIMENKILTEDSVDFDLSKIERSINEICDNSYSDVEFRMNRMQSQIDRLYEKVKSFEDPESTITELNETIEDLTEHVNELQNNDLAPKLARAYKVIEELKEEVASSKIADM